MTARMATYKIRYNLLVQAFPAAYVIKDLLELMKQAEGRFAHNLQNMV